MVRQPQTVQQIQQQQVPAMLLRPSYGTDLGDAATTLLMVLAEAALLLRLYDGTELGYAGTTLVQNLWRAAHGTKRELLASDTQCLA
eukprot:2369865-Rhodomonas_salina.1